MMKAFLCALALAVGVDSRRPVKEYVIDLDKVGFIRPSHPPGQPPENGTSYTRSPVKSPVRLFGAWA